MYKWLGQVYTLFPPKKAETGVHFNFPQGRHGETLPISRMEWLMGSLLCLQAPTLDKCGTSALVAGARLMDKLSFHCL